MNRTFIQTEEFSKRWDALGFNDELFLIEVKAEAQGFVMLILNLPELYICL